MAKLKRPTAKPLDGPRVDCQQHANYSRDAVCDFITTTRAALLLEAQDMAQRPTVDAAPLASPRAVERQVEELKKAAALPRSEDFAETLMALRTTEKRLTDEIARAQQDAPPLASLRVLERQVEELQRAALPRSEDPAGVPRVLRATKERLMNEIVSMERLRTSALDASHAP